MTNREFSRWTAFFAAAVANWDGHARVEQPSCSDQVSDADMERFLKMVRSQADMMEREHFYAAAGTLH
ncbi:hypothetical protein ATO8_18585 [Roseivivax marinus]|uniref:Uncharacterized protein n=1 Tax=Roseivivax marinus TaxID=1379903 RepID=W4HEP8_9RHOB|nr:hypothetical protein [Roseivivax marinus]ETW11189.1 hypothetical protein ATO8_18585 [Roseivivax marinus]